MLPPAETIIEQVRDRKSQRRRLEDIDGIMIHRVGVDLKGKRLIGFDAVSICDAFTGRNPNWPDVARVTSYQNPYTFYIGGNLGPDDYDGKIWQALELEEIGHHALRLSKRYIGVALIGDFRVRASSDKQWTAAAELCSDLCLMFHFNEYRVVGHGELPDAHTGAKALGHPGACPGRFISMDAFRDSVRAEMNMKTQQAAYDRLAQLGLCLSRLPASPY